MGKDFIITLCSDPFGILPPGEENSVLSSQESI